MPERARFAPLRTLTGAVAVVALLWLASFGLVLAAGASPELREADAIVVLGAAHYNGRPSPVFRARLDHALGLYRAGLAPRLVTTGGQAPGDTISEGEVGRRYAIERGVPASAILVERRGLSTAESITGAAAVMRAYGLHRALVVSDPPHMLRVELLARKVGLVPFRAPVPDSPIMQVPRVRWHFVVRESLHFPATALMGNR